MQVHYAGSRGQSSRSSTTFRTTQLPPPGILGLGLLRLGSAATVRSARLTGGLVLMACNQSDGNRGCSQFLILAAFPFPVLRVRYTR